jgi:integrase
LAKLFDIYESEGLHGRTTKHRREIGRKLALWTSFLGSKRRADTLSPADVERFVAARKSQRLAPPGRKGNIPPSMTTVAHDYTALLTALNFALRHRDLHGRPLLPSNPLVGVRVAKSVSPFRPVADDAFYEALKSAAGKNWRFSLALELANATGHRIDAILKLRWSDVTFEEASGSPYGTIRWRGENDKIENEHTLPMNQAASMALAEAARAKRRAPGEDWVFPSETDPLRRVDRHLASKWLRQAERRAGVDHVRGRGWHSFRRGWASARKHWPDVDVAAAGGWKDTATMKRCYQHADGRTILSVILEREDQPVG